MDKMIDRSDSIMADMRHMMMKGMISDMHGTMTRGVKGTAPAQAEKEGMKEAPAEEGTSQTHQQTQ